jgi:uncharacterized protein YecE (DUF72 family)
VAATDETVPLYAGSSGFSYPSWKPGFYPPGTKQAEFLRHYAQRLPSVELNGTYYDLPSEERLSGWAAQTPPGFRFAVKMPRQVTEFGRVDRAATFCERVRVLGERLGPILVSLRRPRDEGFLRLLRDSLDPELRYAWELRHPSWEGLGGVQIVGELDGAADFRYLRLREPPYDAAALADWAARLRPLLARGIEVYCYFKHEDAPSAPSFAARLLELCSAY